MRLFKFFDGNILSLSDDTEVFFLQEKPAGIVSNEVCYLADWLNTYTNISNSYKERVKEKFCSFFIDGLSDEKMLYLSTALIK